MIAIAQVSSSHLLGDFTSILKKSKSRRLQTKWSSSPFGRWKMAWPWGGQIFSFDCFCYVILILGKMLLYHGFPIVLNGQFRSTVIVLLFNIIFHY